MSDDLARFLADRYDEAEALAKAAAYGDWGELWGSAELHDAPHTGRRVVLSSMIIVADVASQAVGDHIAAVDPAHRLADIALKRAILALHQPDSGEWPDCTECSCKGALAATDCTGTVPWPCATARQLGTEFASHPAYKEDWKP